jgi:mannose-1-phosphate guanylyltransferase
MRASSPYLVVMAGGSGTRFWPRSTSRRPKQLLAFGPPDDAGARRTLLARTLERFDGLVSNDRRIVVTTAALRDAIAHEAPAVTVLAEPQGRNTAPCIFWAARTVAERDPDGVMLVMSADHFVSDVDAFRRTVGAAVERARGHDDLVTLGVKPTRPETGYGYLRLGESLGDGCFRVAEFVEKPPRAAAETYWRGGSYLWNSGMFAWRARVVLAAFDRCLPEMATLWDAGGGDPSIVYPTVPATSIDYGVMEKTGNVVTFPLDCGWEDVGSWASLDTLGDALHARAPGGTVLAGEVLAVQSERNVIDVPGKLVALLGVNDLIVVEQDGALLVASKDRAQDVRLVVDEVKKRRPELA